MTLEEFKSEPKQMCLIKDATGPSLNMDCRRSMLYIAILMFRQDTRCKKEDGDYLYTLRNIVDKAKVIIKDMDNSLAERLFLGFQQETQGHLMRHLLNNRWTKDDILDLIPVLVEEIYKVLRG